MRDRKKQQENKPLKILHGQKQQHIHHNEHRGIPVHLSVPASIQRQVSHELVREVLMIYLVDNLHNVRSLKIHQYLLLMTVM